MTLLFELIAVAVLILLNGFFVAAEYGLVTVRRTRMPELAAAGQPARTAGAADHRLAAALHRGDAARRDAHLAGDRRARRARARQGVRPGARDVLAVILAYLILTFLHVVIGELVPKAVALRYSERTALAVRLPVRTFFVVMQPLIWLLQRSTRIAAAGVRPAGAGRDGRRALGGGAEDARQRVDRARRDRGGRAGDALQGLRLRRQGGLRRDGAAARGGRALRRPAAGAGAAGRARVAVHALSGLPRLARRDRRRAPRARPDRGDARARDRVGAGRGPAPPRVHGSRRRRISRRC